MKMRVRFLIAVILVPILLGAEARAEAASFAPSLVTATQGGGASDVLVSFLPGTIVADHYAVYGVSEGALVLLATTTVVEPYAVVPGTYETYAVTGVWKGYESFPVYALGGGCAHVSWNPPGVQVVESCDPDSWFVGVVRKIPKPTPSPVPVRSDRFDGAAGILS